MTASPFFISFTKIVSNQKESYEGTQPVKL